MSRKGGPGGWPVQVGTGNAIVDNALPSPVLKHGTQRKCLSDTSRTVVSEGSDSDHSGVDLEKASVVEQDGESTCADGDAAEEIGKGDDASAREKSSY